MRLIGRVLLVAAIIGGGQVAPAFAQPETTRTGTTSVATVQSRVGFERLTDLVVRRINVGDAVAASKYFSGKPVDDPVREQQILVSVRASAVKLGIDPDETAAFFQAQIDASKVVQRGLLARWAQHPSSAPTTGPDLDAVRKQLDQLTADLLAELVTVDRLRDSGVRCGISLLLATIPAGVHLDRLHRQALKVATIGVC
ncbi:gamma subclass chorismate mutase AroQ [Kribbella antibiotica]|uniref:chorismate mutase n=1 Tax=Kribbella antibiotica TaxID=190195 RepID=A0A4R4ZM89_9ACTN|nr:gamma subclass chorismate mutase AroQ [Kribbella antibiotica]TDD57962.1 gamma subclass chorismate mutase AroQ [Kribbella antibiotica]